MSSPTQTPAPAKPDPVGATETHLGRALALIHKVLPGLDDLDRASAVQSAMEQAAAEIAAARSAHEAAIAARRPAPVEGELLALIAAAVAVVVGRPHRVLDVRSSTPPAVMWVNAWTMEGRFQHYSSHKVR
jgi:hypothetical protein